MEIFSKYIVPYLCIGFVVGITVDTLIRNLQSSKPLTFAESIASIIFWPLVIVGFLKGFFSDKD